MVVVMSRNIKSLTDIFESLDAERQASILDFAEFLQAKGDLIVKEVPDLVDISRPNSETVVGAIKRLKQTYPMIDSMKVFSSASELMTDHMVKGRDVVEVIDEMEKIFEDFYSTMLDNFHK